MPLLVLTMVSTTSSVNSSISPLINTTQATGNAGEIQPKTIVGIILGLSELLDDFHRLSVRTSIDSMFYHNRPHGLDAFGVFWFEVIIGG